MHFPLPELNPQPAVQIKHFPLNLLQEELVSSTHLSRSTSWPPNE